MATAASYVPIEVYLRSSFEPDAEYVDDEIQERSVSELDHAAWQRAIQKWFFLREEEWSVRAFVELRVQVSPSRFRVPDVVVLENTGPLKRWNRSCARLRSLSLKSFLPKIPLRGLCRSLPIKKRWAFAASSSSILRLGTSFSTKQAT